MRTEARRRYTSGFALTEQELRRIHDVADQQMKRALPDSLYESVYELRYRNGAIAEPKNLDDVFEQENWGSAAIRLVSLGFREKSDDPKTKINVMFADPAALDIKGSMSYVVEGEDRDWVFVASSQISERLGRVERVNIPGLADRRFFTLLVMCFTLICFFGAMALTKDPSSEEMLTSIRELRETWKKGELRDPIDVIFRLEETKVKSYASPKRSLLLLPTLIPLVGLPVLLFGAVPMLAYCFPPYHFVWGEYQREYETRRGRMRFILVGIVLALILGITGNILTKKLGW